MYSGKFEKSHRELQFQNFSKKNNNKVDTYYYVEYSISIFK